MATPKIMARIKIVELDGLGHLETDTHTGHVYFVPVVAEPAKGVNLKPAKDKKEPKEE